jgi:hypothetical protein
LIILGMSRDRLIYLEDSGFRATTPEFHRICEIILGDRRHLGEWDLSHETENLKKILEYEPDFTIYVNEPKMRPFHHIL